MGTVETSWSRATRALHLTIILSYVLHLKVELENKQAGRGDGWCFILASLEKEPRYDLITSSVHWLHLSRVKGCQGFKTIKWKSSELFREYPYLCLRYSVWWIWVHCQNAKSLTYDNALTITIDESDLATIQTDSESPIPLASYPLFPWLLQSHSRE